MKPVRLEPGATFLEKLEKQLDAYANDPVVGAMHKSYRYWLAAIRHPDCKRILFDAAQAEQFAPLIEFPDAWQEHVRTPFEHFYLEFSEGVRTGDAWAVGENDHLRAVLYSSAAKPTKVYTGIDPLSGVASYEMRPAAQVVLFYHDPVLDVYTDRNMRIDLRSGQAFVTRYMAERSFEWRLSPSTDVMFERVAHDATYGVAKAVLDGLMREGGEQPNLSRGDLEELSRKLIPTDAHDKSDGLEAIIDDGIVAFVAGEFAAARHVGWWERQAMAATSFLQWTLAYMMAKSIVIEVRDISRQQRRWLQSHGRPLPKPWHVVTVDPRYARSAAEDSDGSKHSYRYDVMGHLRIGRHRVGSKKEDGSYDHRQGLEWVPPHQRGLANELYIPATRAVHAGRRVPREIRTGRMS